MIEISGPPKYVITINSENLSRRNKRESPNIHKKIYLFKKFEGNGNFSSKSHRKFFMS